jgi:threonine dehydrogenase-like Zn-dependent dehydrogenase
MPETATHADAFWVTGTGQGSVRREALPEPGPQEVMVRTLYSGVSRGTETLVFRGEVPESEYARLRAPFQGGDFPGPVKYGYISVGLVEAGPDALLGRTVFCLFPHQTRYVVPVDAVYPLPDGVPAERAVLAANLETAVNGLWDATPRIGDRVTVVGAGTLGCLVAWLAARIPGCTVELVDVNAERAGVAATLGAGFATPATATPDADLVAHTSGNPEGLMRALELAAFEAHVVEMSWYGNRMVPLPLGEGFHARRLSLRSSQVGAVATAQRARWTSRRRLELALRLLVAPALDSLISGEDRFEALPEVMARLARNSGSTLCHRIRYS